MNNILSRWLAEAADCLLATDGLSARGAEEDDEDEEEDKKEQEEDSEDESDGYSE